MDSWPTWIGEEGLEGVENQAPQSTRPDSKLPE